MKAVFVVVPVLLAGGCGPSPTPPHGEGQGTLWASWDGEYAATFAAPASASWCAADSMLQVFAVRDDTAFGLALFVTDTLRPTQHPVLSPQVVVDWRPLALVGMRWLDEREVVGFEGITGVVSLTSVDSGLTGTFDVGFRRPAGSDTVKATGRFSRLAVEPVVGECGRVRRTGTQGG